MAQTHSTASRQRRFETVVIGGSAGSIDALAVLLTALPASLRAAVVVVVHLPREKPSLLRKIFEPRCALPLREVHDKEPLEPGTVYFAPPDYHVLLSGANADGAQGLAAVQAAGGATLVQSPASCLMPFMPEAALARLRPDHVLPPDAMAALLLQWHSGRHL